MAQDQKPKEFFVYEETDTGNLFVYRTPPAIGTHSSGRQIRVIEYSAYETLKKLVSINSDGWKNTEITLYKERARNQKLRAALIDISKSGTINGVKAKKALAEDKE